PETITCTSAADAAPATNSAANNHRASERAFMNSNAILNCTLQRIQCLLDDQILAVVGEDREGHGQIPHPQDSLRQELVFPGLRRPVGGRKVEARPGSPLKLDHGYFPFNGFSLRILSGLRHGGADLLARLRRAVL